MIDAIVTQIDRIVDEERRRADDEHGQLVSLEEGYGVLAEEVMELGMESSEISMDAMNRLLRVIHDDKDGILLTGHVAHIRDKARLAAAEAVQVAAVCERYLAIIGRFL